MTETEMNTIDRGLDLSQGVDLIIDQGQGVDLIIDQGLVPARGQRGKLQITNRLIYMIYVN